MTPTPMRCGLFCEQNYGHDGPCDPAQERLRQAEPVETAFQRSKERWTIGPAPESTEGTVTLEVKSGPWTQDVEVCPASLLDEAVEALRNLARAVARYETDRSLVNPGPGALAEKGRNEDALTQALGEARATLTHLQHRSGEEK